MQGPQQQPALKTPDRSQATKNQKYTIQNTSPKVQKTKSTRRRPPNLKRLNTDIDASSSPPSSSPFLAPSMPPPLPPVLVGLDSGAGGGAAVGGGGAASARSPQVIGWFSKQKQKQADLPPRVKQYRDAVRRLLLQLRAANVLSAQGVGMSAHVSKIHYEQSQRQKAAQIKRILSSALQSLPAQSVSHEKKNDVDTYMRDYQLYVKNYAKLAKEYELLRKWVLENPGKFFYSPSVNEVDVLSYLDSKAQALSPGKWPDWLPRLIWGSRDDMQQGSKNAAHLLQTEAIIIGSKKKRVGDAPLRRKNLDKFMLQLKHHFNPNVLVSWQNLVTLTVELCNKIEELHSLYGVAHGDIKPDNIIVAYDGNGRIWQIELIDFGSAVMKDRLPDNFVVHGTTHFYPVDVQVIDFMRTQFDDYRYRDWVAVGHTLANFILSGVKTIADKDVQQDFFDSRGQQIQTLTPPSTQEGSAYGFPKDDTLLSSTAPTPTHALSGGGSASTSHAVKLFSPTGQAGPRQGQQQQSDIRRIPVLFDFQKNQQQVQAFSKSLARRLLAEQEQRPLSLWVGTNWAEKDSADFNKSQRKHKHHIETRIKTTIRRCTRANEILRSSTLPAAQDETVDFFRNYFNIGSIYCCQFNCQQ